MIYLFTGQPGAGKTLNAIKFLRDDTRFQNRNVYVYNVNGLSVPDWNIIEEGDAKNWFNLPKGSVVFIDECQKLWRPRKAGSTVPDTVQHLETHRHMGIDLVLTCQYPRQIDTGVRRMVTNHYHLFRPFGLNKVTKLTWEKCEDNPDDYHAKQKAQSERVKLDKTIFDLYKSAEVHTVKKSIPKKLYFFVFLIIALIVLIFSIVSTFSNIGDDKMPLLDDVDKTDQSFSFSPSGSSKSLTTRQYIDLQTPRIDNMPESAPVFDTVRKVSSYPRLQCIANSFRTKEGLKKVVCKCYTQQATFIDVSPQRCLSIIERGREFDYSLADTVINSKKPLQSKSKELTDYSL